MKYFVYRLAYSRSWDSITDSRKTVPTNQGIKPYGC